MEASTQTPFDPANKPKTIVFENVSIAFEDRQVLDDVSFALHRGETKALLGIAGSGKTVILKLALGLIRPDSGRIFVLGYEVTAMKEEELFELRRNVGIVFQESALFDSLTVEDNVAYRLNEERVPPEETHNRVVQSLTFVELAHTLNLLPSELSGGMRRRVAIARAIVSRPEIMLYDSPTGGLDPVTSTKIVELIVRLRDELKTSALLVSHRLQDAFTMATSIYDPAKKCVIELPPGSTRSTNTTFLVLKDGKKIFDGTAAELVHDSNEYIREYLS